MIDSLTKVIEIAKKKKVLTLYTQQIYDHTKLNNLQKEQYELDGKLITCDIATEGYKFYRLNPPKELVYIKYNFNIFSNPALYQTLKDKGIKTLLITGVDAQYCVETAIRNGFDLGYKIVVPEDLIAANANFKYLQERTLDLVKQTYGVVIQANDLFEIWQ